MVGSGRAVGSAGQQEQPVLPSQRLWLQWLAGKEPEGDVWEAVVWDDGGGGNVRLPSQCELEEAAAMPQCYSCLVTGLPPIGAGDEGAGAAARSAAAVEVAAEASLLLDLCAVGAPGPCSMQWWVHACAASRWLPGRAASASRQCCLGQRTLALGMQSPANYVCLR